MTKERLAVFIDGANHGEALQLAKVKMDYSSFLKQLKASYNVVAARYYSGISQKDEHKNVRDFLGGVSKSGYALVTKPVREYRDGKVKADMDVEIAVDMVTMAPRLDKIMLFSGDGDFCYAIDTVQRMGVRVAVCGYKLSSSMELRERCDEFIDLRNIHGDKIKA